MRALGYLVLLVSSSAAADRIGPAPEAWRPSKEVACDRSAPAPGAIGGIYTCQFAIDGTWGQVAPCRVSTPPKPGEYEGSLVLTKFLSCSIHGAIGRGKSLAFDGAVWCEPKERDQIGHEALVTGQLRAIAGGYRLDADAEMVKTYAAGPPAIPRKTRLVTTKSKIVLNVCTVR